MNIPDKYKNIASERLKMNTVRNNIFAKYNIYAETLQELMYSGIFLKYGKMDETEKREFLNLVFGPVNVKELIVIL